MVKRSCLIKKIATVATAVITACSMSYVFPVSAYENKEEITEQYGNLDPGIIEEPENLDDSLSFIDDTSEERELYGAVVDSEKLAWDVLDIVNEERAAIGAEPLVMDANLVKTAKVRADEITTLFDHTRPDGTSCFTAYPSDIRWWAKGENIAAGQTSAAAVMKAWMNSSGHRANILSNNFNCVGIALVYIPNSTYRYYWVQNFGYTDSPTAAVRPQQSSAQNTNNNQSTNTNQKKYIKGICQMPYTGEGGGYLIGIESYDNPNQSYQYEMLILDCTLYAQGLPAWIYTTGKCGAPGNCLWTIWQPQYGYYWTLFRVFDANGNMLDQECYGFANVY